MHWRLMLLAIVVTALSPAAIRAQQEGQPAAGEVAFEVASVKRNTAGTSMDVSIGPRPGGYAAINSPLRLIIELAFGVRSSQVVGGPAWLTTERFDITARAAEGTPRNAILPMVRTLLRDRFQLKSHTEIRQAPVYALVLARADRRTGPQLKQSTVECSSDPVTPNPCSMNGTIGSSAKGFATATGQTLTQLAAYLGRNLDRPVVDRTGLSGRFDFEIRWVGDTLTATDPGATVRTNDGPSLAIVLQEQLGLKLEAATGPVEFLVIDSAALPAPD